MNDAPDRIWLVYSHEHGAWWGPNRSGYFLDINSAGRYTKAEAEECCDSRSKMPDGGDPEVMAIAPEAADLLAAEREAREKAEAACAAMVELLRECHRDMFDTARVNQGSINGVELNCPDDPPCEAWIGKQRMTQRGVDETLALIKRVQRTVSAANPGAAILARLEQAEAENEKLRPQYNICVYPTFGDGAYHPPRMR